MESSIERIHEDVRESIARIERQSDYIDKIVMYLIAHFILLVFTVLYYWGYQKFERRVERIEDKLGIIIDKEEEEKESCCSILC